MIAKSLHFENLGIKKPSIEGLINVKGVKALFLFADPYLQMFWNVMEVNFNVQVRTQFNQFINCIILFP